MISTLLLSWKHNYIWHHTHYIWHHSHCICAATPALSINHKNFGSYPTLHTYDIVTTLQDITVTLYDNIPQCLWHHSHCIHDIRSPTSPPVFMTSRLLSLWHHRHYLCEYLSTIFNIKHMERRQYNHYNWNHSLHICICMITHSVSLI